MGLSLSILLASLGTSGANVALPTLARVFGASFGAVQWIVLAYLLAVTTMIVGAGRLGDIVGRKRLLQLGIVLFTSASLMSGLAPSLTVLVMARALQGTGAAVMMSLSMAFIGDAVTPSRVGRAMGLLGTMSAAGTALGPSLGGMLLTFPGWRALFLINVPLGLAALWFVRRSLPERRQARARASLVPLSLLRDRALLASLASNTLVACVMMSTLIVGPFYLTRALGLAPATMGLVMTVGPVLTAIAGVPAGRFVDARGAHRATQAGLMGMLAGSVLLAVLPLRIGVSGYVGSVFFLTIGYALFQAANNTAVMAAASSDDRGLVSGVLNLSRSLGLITGASLMGAVFALASGVANVTTAQPDAVARGMHVTFVVAASLVTIALVMATRRPSGSRASRLAQ